MMVVPGFILVKISGIVVAKTVTGNEWNERRNTGYLGIRENPTV
tara:strand:+ start:488 stop:619 length:132 start_codon:yes stop_codon:yes gene_type:complete